MSETLTREREIELAWQQHRGPEWRLCALAKIRARLSERQNHRCCWCGVRTVDEPGPTCATIEHIVPRSKGGGDNEGNLAMSCRRCNGTRGDDILGWLPREWCFTSHDTPIVPRMRNKTPSKAEIHEWMTYRSSRTSAREYLEDLFIRVDRYNAKHHGGLTWWEFHHREFAA